MKLTWKIWLLGISLIFSLIMLINTNSSSKVLIMLLLFGALFALNFSKTNKSGVLLFALLVLTAIFFINYSFQSGVTIKSVDKSITNEIKAGEVLVSINGQEIKTKQDYAQLMEKTFVDDSTKKLEIVTTKNKYILFLNQTPEITLEEISKTNIQTGLDLRGGARALVQPEVKIDDNQMNDLIQISRNRFNIYGLSDVQIKGVSDLSGNNFMLVEVAGATPSDLESLIGQQGKFEAKVGNKTVFEGGKKDISRVCKNDASCSGIESCSASQDGGYYCNFRFTIYLTEEAAKKHAEVTDTIEVDNTGQYLSEKLYLYVDEKEVDSLLIGVDLKGQTATQIMIRGAGAGATKEEAFKAAQTSMNKLQTVLITGSLPYKLNIVKLDTISPSLGNDFSYILLLTGAIAMFIVALIVFIKYRKIKASFALLFTSFSELIIILGVASFIKWNLDLPSIAGILATIGTGVDSQIVILDEAEKKHENTTIKEKIKIAIFVVMTSFATNVASLIPLYWAGAGLFKGFAITTIIGVSAGVFIARPAFAEMIKRIEGE